VSRTRMTHNRLIMSFPVKKQWETEASRKCWHT